MMVKNQHFCPYTSKENTVPCTVNRIFLSRINPVNCGQCPVTKTWSKCASVENEKNFEHTAYEMVQFRKIKFLKYPIEKAS